MTLSQLMEANINLTNEIITRGGRPPKTTLRSGNRVPLTQDDYQQIHDDLKRVLAEVKGEE